MDLKVSLRPHIGKQRSDVLGKPVEFDVDMKQCFVMCNDRTIGIYCGRQNEPNKYLSFTESIPQPLQAAIAAEVAKITGGVGSFNAPPPDEHEVSANDDE